MQTIYDAKLLLVDDTPDLLTLLCEHLRAAGYQTIATAQNCAQARAAFAAARPELMILDINLPDGDGFALFRQLRAQADVPALFLSARDADADRLFGLGLGADDYLTKPFLMQELLLRVQHILQRAYRAELQRGAAGRLALGARTVELADAPVGGRRRLRLRAGAPAGRAHAALDGHRARAAAKTGRKPRPHRHLRRAV